MSESFAASNVELEAIDLLLRAERAHLELAEKIRVHREGLESFFNAHHRQSDLVSDCDEQPVAEQSHTGRGAKPARMEPESKSCPSTAPNSATHETSPSTARTTDEPCVVSRRQVCETFEALFDYEAPHLPRFKRVDDSYLAVMGLEVYREVAKEPEPANVGAVRCNFLKGQPGSMVRLAGSEGYWLKVSPRLETGAYSPKIEASQAVLGVYEMMNGVKLGRPVGDINQDIIYDAQIPTLRRFELAKGEGNGMPVYREVRGEVEMVRSIGSTHPGADLLVRLEDKDGLWYRG